MQALKQSVQVDVFISHASEDKAAVARPLSELLRAKGLRVWLDEAELRIGDSLRRSIDAGLAKCRFGVVIVSPAFLSKEWPQKELDALVAREDGTQKVILPVWHQISRSELIERSPLLADRLAADTQHGLAQVATEIAQAVAEHSTPIENRVHGRGVSELLVNLFDELQARSDSPQPYVTGIPTGFYDLDTLTSGLQAGSLVTLAGHQMSGKTSLAINLAEHVAVNEGLPIIFFALADRSEAVMRRFMCAMARVEPHGLSAARLPDEGWTSLVQAAERLKGASIRIVDSPALSFPELLSALRAEAEHVGKSAGLVVIDSLEFIRSDLTKSGRPEGLVALRRLALELRCPILLIADVESADRADPRPILDDLKTTERLVQISDTVLFLHRARRKTDDVEIVEVIVAKQKSGFPVGTVLLGFQGQFGKFNDLGSR